jgi:ribose-phosphate pyrophosphokinase
VSGRRAIIVDDMVSTGSTIEAAVKALAAAGCCEARVVVATHGLLVGDALERLAALPISRLLVTDSVPQTRRSPVLEVVTLAPLLAAEIRRLEAGRCQ